MIKKRRFKAGEVLIRENDLGETAFIIERGRVEVTQRIAGVDVHLTSMGPGETCGEMSMIDDKPRSATVTALETTEVREIDHDGFYEALRTDPAMVLDLLRSLFERLRDAEATIQKLCHDADFSGGALSKAVGQDAAEPTVVLEGLTGEARDALPTRRYTIEKFPFRIGRQSYNPLVHNDLKIVDSSPWQISRHHVALVLQDSRVGVIDRGSRHGCEIDGKRFGGSSGDPGPMFFEGSEGTLLLGKDDSLFQFKVVVKGP